MHPELVRFIEKFQREAQEKGSYRAQLGKAEIAFLEEVWEPAFEYRYEGLKAEYPFKAWKGGQRFADFVYIRNGCRLLIEIDGYTTHARDISPGDHDDHLVRQNDLVLMGGSYKGSLPVSWRRDRNYAKDSLSRRSASRCKTCAAVRTSRGTSG